MERFDKNEVDYFDEEEDMSEYDLEKGEESFKEIDELPKSRQRALNEESGNLSLIAKMLIAESNNCLQYNKIHQTIVFFIMTKLTITTEKYVVNHNFLENYEDWYDFCIDKLHELKDLSLSDENYYNDVLRVLLKIYPILLTFEEDITNLYDMLLPLLS
jgi:hypothetical protein